MQATAKMKAAAGIVINEAFQAVASKNGVSVQFVRDEVAAGNLKAINQLAAFLSAGVGAALALHEQGAISLV